MVLRLIFEICFILLPLVPSSIVYFGVDISSTKHHHVVLLLITFGSVFSSQSKNCVSCNTIPAAIFHHPHLHEIAFEFPFIDYPYLLRFSVGWFSSLFHQCSWSSQDFSKILRPTTLFLLFHFLASNPMRNVWFSFFFSEANRYWFFYAQA